jgi:catechol 2,3-dioxygenase-like lactoylglutathione lyase family enzyme
MREEPRVIYQVSDFERGRDFYKRVLGFDETFVDFDERWSTLSRGAMHIAVTHGDPDPDAGVAMVDVDDIKAEADRLRQEGVNVGTVIELAGQMRLVDVFDPDGNRIQLAQPLNGS